MGKIDKILLQSAIGQNVCWEMPYPDNDENANYGCFIECECDDNGQWLMVALKTIG